MGLQGLGFSGTEGLGGYKGSRVLGLGWVDGLGFKGG